jgi:3-deoxy-D-manno-octulosonate 8-phosphate phosphatase (KDO 8-P phosphatase)
MPSLETFSFQSVRHFIFDIDGVLTDGSVWVMPGGEQVRRMNIKDGYALQLAIKMGYTVTVISGSARSAVDDRLLKLGILDVHFGVVDKASFLLARMSEMGWDPSLALYMGDDVPDLGANILSAAQYISPRGGGMGCVRDVIEQVLRLNDHWSHQPDIASR